jgi:hypothetical protein
MCDGGCHSEDRIRRGHCKKLTAALRYQLERKATDDFLLDLMAEEPDAAGFGDRVDPPELTSDQLVYLTAFNRLMHDRQYGAFGGATPISYVAISAYAGDFGIVGEAFDVFLRLIGALDGEYLAHLERTKPSTYPAAGRAD